jgi:uncharacterized membrane protein YhaH (DUF805 family)
MDFPQAIVSVGKKNYINSAGRASRSEYWYWALFCFLGGVATQALDQVVVHKPITNLIFVLATFVPSIAVAIRRLHDVNRKGTWLLISFTIIGSLYPLLVWFCKKGTDGNNRFGSDPLATP